MNYLLTPVFFLMSFCGFSQRDSLTIVTDIAVDSVYHLNHKLDFSQVNDSVLKMEIQRNVDSAYNTLVIYSGKKRYEASLPANPDTAFPGEWIFRDPGFPVSMQASIKKGQMVILTASGSAMHTMSGLSVYGPNDKLISKESCGVYFVKERRRKK